VLEAENIIDISLFAHTAKNHERENHGKPEMAAGVLIEDAQN
jgi:hypothetical protein